MTFDDSATAEKSVASIVPAGPWRETMMPGSPMEFARFNSANLSDIWSSAYHSATFSVSTEQLTDYLPHLTLDVTDLSLGLFDAESALLSARSIQDLVEVARSIQLDDAADQIEELSEDLKSDPDSSQFDEESVRHALVFLDSHRDLPDPDVGVRRGGLIDLNWHVPPDGVLTVCFDTSGAMIFATNVAGRVSGERQRVSGTTTDTAIVACVFSKLLATQQGE